MLSRPDALLDEIHLVPRFRATVASDEFAIIRFIFVDADDEFEAVLIAQQEFVEQFKCSDEGLHITVLEVDPW